MLRRLALAMMTIVAFSARAYAPGSGTLASDDFQDGNDAGWEYSGSLSKWTIADRAGSKVYLADAQPDLFRALPETSMRPFIAVPVGTFDLCFQVVRGTGAAVTWDVRPPRDDQPAYRLTLATDGSATIDRLDASGAPTLVAAVGGNRVPENTPTWLHLQLRPGAGGVTDAGLRIWTGGAAAEPAAWDVRGSTLAAETLPYVQRALVSATQPRGSESWIDEVDLFGDTSAGVLSSVKTVWILEASHLDIGFTAPPADIEAFAKSHLDQVVANLRAAPDYRWTIENCWQLLRWMERSTPAEIQELFDLARAGRITLSAGYANLHTTVTSRQELIRALAFSQDIGRTQGIPVTTYIQDDVPGSSWALPELLSRAGVTHYLGGMNCSFGGVTSAPSHATRPFWWEGPDGSRVLSWITFDSYAEGIGLYGMSFFDDLAKLHQGLGRGLGEQERLGYPHENLLVMRVFDNHYQGLFVRNLVQQWNAAYSTPRLKLASADEFFDAVTAEAAAKGWTIPTFRGDFGGAWSASIPSTAHTQAWVNDARHDAQAADAFAALATAVAGAPHPTSGLGLAWRRILEVDEHSGGGLPWPGLLTPSEADRAARAHQDYATEAQASASAALAPALAALSQRVDLPRGGFIAWNALDAARSAPVHATLPPSLVIGRFRLVDSSTAQEVAYQQDPDAPGGIVFVAEDVPAFGWKAFRVLPGIPSDLGTRGLAVTATTVESDAHRVALDPADGSVTSIVELATGRELVNLASSWRFGQSAWNSGSNAFWGVTPTADVPTAARTSVVASGPVLAALAVDRDGTPAARMEVLLWRGLDRVEIRSTFDRSRVPYVPYASGSREYALTFPLAATSFDFATESPAKLLRPATDGFARASTFAQLNTTGCVETTDAAGTLVLASPETMVSEWGGISYGLPAHRTTEATWFVRVKDVADEAEYEGGTIAPGEQEPGTSPLYPATILLGARDAGLPDSAARREGLAFVEPMRATWVDAATGAWPAGGRALVALDDADARLFSVERTGDGATLARIEDMAGAPRDVRLVSPLTLTSASDATLFGDAGATLATDAAGVIVPVAPFATTTVRLGASDGIAPTLLFVRKDSSRGEVLLDWTGGAPAFRVLRSLRRDLSGDSTVVATAHPLRSLADGGVLADGNLWFYDVE